MIVPVPLGQARLRDRGFNQATLLARPLGRRLALPVASAALLRRRETRSQVGLGYRQRTANVRGAFGAREETVAGERVLLVDDLCTTGSTLAACARALISARAAAVFGLTVARAR